jgi:hypothetical protein
LSRGDCRTGSAGRHRMKRPRFTIAEIILFVLVLAIGLAAIRSGSDAWAGAIFSVTYFALICSLLGIAFGRRARRVYWVGFALLGWGYLSLFYVPWAMNESVGEALLGANFFQYVGDIVHPELSAGVGLQSLPPAVVGANTVGGGFGGGPGPGPNFALINARANVVRIGTVLEALLWAFLGGWVARYFASGPEGAAGEETNTSGLAPADPATAEPVQNQCRPREKGDEPPKAKRHAG